MRIGLDFNNVVADKEGFRRKLIREVYRIQVPPQIFERGIVTQGILDNAQYERIQKMMYKTEEYHHFLEPVDGALEFIPLLEDLGHEVEIITSMGEEEAGIFSNWLSANGSPLRIKSAGRNDDKSEFSRGLDVFLDDDPGKLRHLMEVVPHRFLFETPYNVHLHIPTYIGIRAHSWADFYRKVKQL